jgi:formylglycine-generating enzyme required for sulfatase activity
MTQRSVAGITLALMLLLGLASTVAPADTLTITAKQAVVRAGPDGKQAILTTAPQGATFALLETHQGWYRVLLDDGREGWVAQSAAQVQRGLVRQDAPASQTPAFRQGVQPVEGFDPAESAGVFVGIRRFDDPRFTEVPFAIDDAIDLAYLLALELQLIAPVQVTLSLAGTPQKPASATRLRALLGAGAQQQSARLTDIYAQVEEQRQKTKERGLFVVAIATHGFSDEGGDFLVASDSRRTRIRQTGLAVDAVFDEVSRARAPRRLVFLDACRERLMSDARGGMDPASAMSQAFANAIAKASGQVVLFGSTIGGYAYDDFTLKNGVFTAAVLEGLRGKAPRDSRGFITDQTLADYVNARVRAWVQENRPDHMSISQGISRRFEGGTVPIPLVALQKASPTASDSPRVAVGSYPQQPTPPATIVGNDGAEMVLVPAGEFIMRGEGYDDANPRHQVYLDAFYIDKYEVTNAHFQQFVQVTGFRTQAERAGASATWRAPQGVETSIAGLGQHPVVHVSQEDAKAYCTWAGKRLPTEAEWEKAARGTDGRIYPWGNQFDGKLANFCDRNCKYGWRDSAANDGYLYTAPVGSYEGGKSPYGAYDMAGNVWEWVADWYDANYYRNSPARNPKGPASGDQAVLRGGGWNGFALGVRAPARNRFAPALQNDNVGFRCAKTL